MSKFFGILPSSPPSPPPPPPFFCFFMESRMDLCYHVHCALHINMLHDIYHIMLPELDKIKSYLEVRY